MRRAAAPAAPSLAVDAGVVGGRGGKVAGRMESRGRGGVGGVGGQRGGGGSCGGGGGRCRRRPQHMAHRGQGRRPVVLLPRIPPVRAGQERHGGASAAAADANADAGPVGVGEVGRRLVPVRRRHLPLRRCQGEVRLQRGLAIAALRRAADGVQATMTMTVSVAAPSRAEGLLAVAIAIAIAIAVAIAVARARPRGRAGVEAEVGGLPAVAGLGRPPAPRHRGGLGAEGHRLAPLATAAGRFPPTQDYLAAAASRDVAAVAVH